MRRIVEIEITQIFFSSIVGNYFVDLTQYSFLRRLFSLKLICANYIVSRIKPETK